MPSIAGAGNGARYFLDYMCSGPAASGSDFADGDFHDLAFERRVMRRGHQIADLDLCAAVARNMHANRCRRRIRRAGKFHSKGNSAFCTRLVRPGKQLAGSQDTCRRIGAGIG